MLCISANDVAIRQAAARSSLRICERMSPRLKERYVAIVDHIGTIEIADSRADAERAIRAAGATPPEPEHPAIGRGVHYTGDCANAPRVGFVSGVRRHRWGIDLEVTWLDPSIDTGWEDEDGEPVTRDEPQSWISERLIVEPEAHRPGERFCFTS